MSRVDFGVKPVMYPMPVLIDVYKRQPKGFAEMLAHIAERDCMAELPFIRK